MSDSLAPFVEAQSKAVIVRGGFYWFHENKFRRVFQFIISEWIREMTNFWRYFMIGMDQIMDGDFVIRLLTLNDEDGVPAGLALWA
jgi:hypothetical protein